ncbi:MAG TPA: hypothetical protein VIA98_06255 [Allosphingosinicella sp.]
MASQGSLGGSQAGFRVRYRLNKVLVASARLASPLRGTGAAEVAIGAEWQPVRTLPLRLLAERRQAIGSTGRSAFALTAHGGVSDARLPAGFKLDAYGQTGAVGTRSRDLFAEASLRVARKVTGGLSVGPAAWAAAQPKLARIDAGLSVRLHVPALHASLSADWRFRLAGRAGPASGPALTLWTDF